MGFSLNQIIEAALLDGHDGSLLKIAQEAEGETTTCEACGKRPATQGSKFCQECAAKAAKNEERESRTEESQEKTSSERVTSLANAVQYLVDNPGAWLGVGSVKTAEGEEVNKTGPARGPNTLPTNVAGPTTDLMPASFSGSKVNKIPEKPAQEAGANPKAPQNAMATDKESRPGGDGNYPEEGVMVQKTSSAIERMKVAMLKKRAADGDSTSISTPKTSALPEDQPSQVPRPAEVTGQEKMVSSNEAAIDFTKREAKAVPKKRMGEVLDEPAQSKSGDTALHDALGSDLVNQAGAKIASARDIVQKLASQGCTCGGSSDDPCGFCKIASRIGRTPTSQVGAQEGAVQGTDRS